VTLSIAIQEPTLSERDSDALKASPQLAVILAEGAGNVDVCGHRKLLSVKSPMLGSFVGTFMRRLEEAVATPSIMLAGIRMEVFSFIPFGMSSLSGTTAEASGMERFFALSGAKASVTPSEVKKIAILYMIELSGRSTVTWSVEMDVKVLPAIGVLELSCPLIAPSVSDSWSFHGAQLACARAATTASAWWESKVLGESLHSDGETLCVAVDGNNRPSTRIAFCVGAQMTKVAFTG